MDITKYKKIELTNIPPISCVYLILHKIEKKFYIGYTYNLQKRLRFIKSKQKGTYYFIDNPKNFEYYIINQDNDIKKLMKLEAELIIKYKNNQLIYNKTRKILEIPQILSDIKTKKKFISQINILEKNECWNWYGKIGTDKYGKFNIGKCCFVAHRIAYYYFKNKWAGYLLVRHKCNNKLCCNPKHLELGTDQENSQDAAKDGLLSHKNLNHYKSKFSKEDVEKMIKLRKQQKTMNEISNIFKLGKYGDTSIYNVLSGKVKTLKKYLGDFDNSIYGKNGIIKCKNKDRQYKTEEEKQIKQKEYKEKIKRERIEKQTKIILNWLANYSYMFSNEYVDNAFNKFKNDVRNIKLTFPQKLFEDLALNNNYLYEYIYQYNNNLKLRYKLYKFK